MATTMYYKYPSKNKGCAGNNGFVKVDGVLFDYKILDESEANAKTLKGWSKTAREALNAAKPKKTEE